MFSIVRLSILAVCTFLLFASGCSSKQKDLQKDPGDSSFAVTCVGVLPAQAPARFDTSKISPAEQKQFETGLSTLTRLLRDEFIGRSDVRIVTDAQFSGITEDTAGDSLSRIRTVADRVSCNAVLETTLRVFEERVGGKYSAKTPASAAFGYRLVAIPDGTVLCNGSFDETQKSVMENLYNFSTATHRGFTWVSAEQLLREGVHAQFDECMYLSGNK